MGYILNRFDRLMELKENPSSTKQFKLTAVIVHDPKDKDLCDHIRDFFLQFAQITGKNFLFITFIQPPKEYIDALRKGEYENAKYLVSDVAQGGDVDKLIDPLLREYYDLPDGMSYMVLGKSLSDTVLYKVPITKASLPYQFMRLRMYCDNPTDFDTLRTDLKAETYNAKDELINSLLKVVSLVSPAGNPDDYRLGYGTQIETALQTIREEKQNLRELLKHGNQDLTEKILNIYAIIENSYLKVLNNGKKPLPTVKCQHFSELDTHSRRFWNTYYRLSTIDTNEEFSELDYSAFVLYFGKIVDNELNLSVGQMIRDAMGIDMPSNYNRYCAYKGRVDIPTEKMNVPINRHKRHGNKTELEGVPMGNLLHAYLTTIGKEHSSYYRWKVEHPERIKKQLPDSFLDFWREFADVRNTAAHTGDTTKEKYNSAKDSFTSFLAEYVEGLYKLKCELRPNDNKRRKK